MKETYSERGILKARTLMDLGEVPARHILYTGRHAFSFNPAIEERLHEMGVRFETEELETLFKPFLKPETQIILDRYASRRKSRRRAGDASPGPGCVHIFDARRLYYLRFARTDSGELGTRHWKFLDIFLGKSRDEIECLIEDMERDLPPRESANYVYAALGIALRVAPFLRDHPSALGQDVLDGHIMDALCAVDSDKAFFSGVDRASGDALHPYLQKYAWLYFDSDFHHEAAWPDPFRLWQRAARQPAPRPSVSLETACAVFEIAVRDFRSMSRREFMRLYRRKAKKIHPDTGGEHEEFVRLAEAYERLLCEK